jgi:hypothetical protein
MTVGVAQRFNIIERRLTELEKKFTAMREDLEEAPEQLQDLVVPRFPRILREIGYDPPEADRSSSGE